jgi:hypothetical protein
LGKCKNRFRNLNINAGDTSKNRKYRPANHHRNNAPKRYTIIPDLLSDNIKMIQHSEISDNGLHIKIRRKEICYGGNKKLKIYGLLDCSSGKRIKRENRVFFTSAREAQQNNYRPCGHCMKAAYIKWKHEFI